MERKYDEAVEGLSYCGKAHAWLGTASGVGAIAAMFGGALSDNVYLAVQFLPLTLAAEMFFDAGDIRTKREGLERKVDE